jgi:histone acetyltransferase (RNA polymerase elongator complex component)
LANRPFIIPVFITHMGCPHQCLFCNQHNLTGDTNKRVVAAQIRPYAEQFLSYKGKQREESQLAFYGGNFLGIGKEYMTSLLEVAAEMVAEGMVQSIRFSTRPDSITHEHLKILSAFPVSTIELGVQSMDDRVLSLTKRGHTAQDTETAVKRLKSQNYQIGLQLMVGLPGDSQNTLRATVQKTAAMLPDFLRIYPTIVLKGSPLARWFEQGEYVPLTLSSCISLVKDCLLFFWEKNIPIIRMGLQASERLQMGTSILAGPYHPAFGHLVYSEIFLDRVTSYLKQNNSGTRSISIYVHPKNTSRLRGLNNQNIEVLKNIFHLKTIHINQDPNCPVGKLVINKKSVTLPIRPEISRPFLTSNRLYKTGFQACLP